MEHNYILIKKREYNKLKKQAESKKQDNIEITLFGGYDRLTGRYAGISSTLDLSSGIYEQINRIRKLMYEEHRKQMAGYEKLFFEYRTMGFFHRLFFGIDNILHKYEK